MKHFVMGTAGHAGHGKTALIHALTGTRPDAPPVPDRPPRVGLARMRFDETLLDIMDLPGGAGEVETMISGMADADMALLTVAADEGIMAQTLEHLRILSLFDLSRCIVVLTKTDLISSEMLALAREEVRGLYSAWGLPVCTPVVEVSAHTGEGVERLIGTIVEQCAMMPVRRQNRPFYMHVDWMEFRSGEELAVSGAVREGTVRPGEEIMLCPSGKTARIRSISGGEPLKMAEAGQRALMELSVQEGIREHVSALSAILPDRAAGSLDARIVVLPECERSLEHGMRLRLYVGTTWTVCRVNFPKRRCLAPGNSGYGQLVPETPLPALTGERFILRFLSQERLAGGGVILDAQASPRGQADWRKALARMSCYEYGGMDGRLHWDASEALCSEAALRKRFARWSDEEFRRTRDALLMKGLLVRAGDLLLGAQLAGSLKGELIARLTSRHAHRPLEPGMPIEEAKTICPGGLLELCIRDGTVRFNEFCVSLPLFDPRKTKRYWQVAAVLLEVFRRKGPMDRWELVKESGLPEREADFAAGLLEADGRLTFLEREQIRERNKVGIG